MKKVREIIKIKRCKGKMHGEKLSRNRSSRLEVPCKEGVLRNFAKFIGKHLCQSLVLMNLLTVYYFRRSFTLHKKWSFLLRISCVNVTKSARNIFCVGSWKRQWHLSISGSTLFMNYIITYFYKIKVKFLKSAQTSFSDLS